MILLLDTSTALCKLTLIDGDARYETEWQADRTLARELLGYIKANLDAHSWTWTDISGIGVLQGPGSFTGLRIGLTILNTLADSQSVPIVGGQGEDWQDVTLEKLKSGQNDRIVLPFYGGDAHITTPRK